MKYWYGITLIGIIIISLFISLVSPVGAQESHNFGDLEQQIKDLEQKIADAQSRERTLASQIRVMDNQISLTTLRITENTKKIEQLEKDIDELTQKIGILEQSLNKLSTVLISRVISTYKTGRLSYFAYLFSATNVADILNRTKYIELAQAHDKRVLFEVQEAKATYGEQKSLREEKKIEAEELKTQLEGQKRQLDTQRRERQTLLDQTRNSEAEYQRQLQQALLEKNALEAALVSGVKVGPVAKGDPIALVGNTGYPYCSTGAHLHFEIRKDNNWINAADYLKSRSVIDDQNGGGEVSVGSGGWDWPLDGTVRVTQFYGHTPYSWRYTYSGGIHTGIDMVSDTSNVIKAPEKGTLYTSSQSCGGSTIKIKYIEHENGIISFYLHVQ